MQNRPWSLILALTAAGCAAAQAPTLPVTDVPMDGALYLNGNTYRLLGREELPVVGLKTDSDAPGYDRARITDGDLSTQWSNGGFKNPSSWVALELAAAADLGSVAIKTGPSPAGTSFDLQVSPDGASWTTVSAGLTNSSWGLETKTLPAGTAGRFVRVFWHNSASSPQGHFALFELAVNGTVRPTATPTPPEPTATPTPLEPTPTPPEPTPSPQDPTPTPLDPTPTPAADPGASDAGPGPDSGPGPDGSPTPTPTPVPTEGPPGPVERQLPRAITANSSYPGLDVGRAADGSQATQWGSGGYQDPQAWLQLELDRSVILDHVALKTGALPSGASFAVEASEDGAAWTPASGTLTNTSWNLETKPVVGRGRFLRVRFNNSPTAPLARFYVFELEAYGAVPGAGGGPVATPPPPPPPTAGSLPQPLRRLDTLAVASGGNGPAALDADPTTQWIGPGAGSWLAVKLATPATDRVLVAWDGSGYHLLNTQGVPRTYAIEGSTNSPDGRSGNWAQDFRTVDNPLRSRMDAFAAPGATWLRLRVESLWSGGPALRNLAVYELPPGPADSWLILGDSITALAFDPSRPSICASTVAAKLPGRLPVIQAGGTGGDTAALGQAKLAQALPLLPPGGYVGLAFGTNDATQGVPVASFKATMQAMIDSIVASGRTPMLARTPYDLNGQLPLFVAAVDQLTAANRLAPGPDLYGWFKDHKNELGPDTVHPTVTGQASIQRLWGEAIARAYGAL